VVGQQQILRPDARPGGQRAQVKRHVVAIRAQAQAVLVGIGHERAAQQFRLVIHGGAGGRQGEKQKCRSADADPDGFVYLLPKDIRDNTVKAFNLGYVVTQVTGQPSVATVTYTGNGAPTGRFIAPAGFANCAQAYIGQCGFANLILHGPSFFRFDLAMAKKIRFTENVNLELRMEFLNAFNNINFQPGASGNDVNGLGNLTSSAFGRMTSAYQDLSTTNDPGGRIGQVVVRLNF